MGISKELIGGCVCLFGNIKLPFQLCRCYYTISGLCRVLVGYPLYFIETSAPIMTDPHLASIQPQPPT